MRTASFSTSKSPSSPAACADQLIVAAVETIPVSECCLLVTVRTIVEPDRTRGEACMGAGSARMVVGTLLVGAPAAGFAQQAWAPGSEITGQSVSVETAGVTNTVYLIGVGRSHPDAGRQHRSGHVERRERPTLPVDRGSSGMLALCLAVPGRPTGYADEQLQCGFALDRSRHQPTPSEERRRARLTRS